jgi:hypothetical protein
MSLPGIPVRGAVPDHALDIITANGVNHRLYALVYGPEPIRILERA